MPTVKEDATLSLLSYLDKPSDLKDKHITAENRTLAKCWQDMQADGWEYLGNQDDYISDVSLRNTGFQAHVYRSPDGQIVFAMRGTSELKDFIDDAVLAFHFEPDQVDSMKDFVANVLDNHPSNQSVHFTGHSLGGYLAAKGLIFIKNNYPGFESNGLGFNDPGIAEAADNYSDSFVSLCHKADQVNHFGGDHLGEVYDLDGDYSFSHILASHFMVGLVETIDQKYSLLGEIDVAHFLSLSSNEKQDLLASSSEFFLGGYSQFYEEHQYTDQQQDITESRSEFETAITIDAALDSYFSDLDEQAAEITARQTIAEGRETREEDLAILGTRNDLGEAIDSGDTVSIIAAGFDYLSALDERIDNGPNEGGFLNEEAEAGIDLASTGIKLGQAIDEGEGWDIAKEGLDFTKDLDRYLDNNASTDGFLSNKGASAIGMASAGISLASAIDTGDGLAIAQSGVDLASNINSFAEGSEALGDGLGAVGSAVSLAINIGKIDDVYASGDAGAIAYTTLNTVNNAINTYNYAASALGYANAGLQSVPGLGYIGAAIQLAEGDVQGAAVTAASTYLMTLGPYGWAAAAVLQIANMLLADDSPPQATASFELDANGNVVMSVSGDSEMQAGAASYGNAVMSVMQQYKDGGDRLVIDNSMPSLHVVSGEGVSIEYESEYGGKGHLSITDEMNPVEQMLSVLIARDRGDRLDDAVRMSRVEGGGIDFDQVASILSGYGFTRQGINFTYGEDNSDRIGHAFGTGIFIGGGSAGPEGQLFTARREDIKSLPLREEQLPSQTLGQVLKVSGLNMFAGRGAELLAMAMVFPGLLAAPGGRDRESKR